MGGCWCCRDDDVHLEADQSGGQTRKPVGHALRGSVLQGDVPANHIAKVVEFLPEDLEEGIGGSPVRREHTHPGHLPRRLRPDRERCGEEAEHQDDHEDPQRSCHAPSRCWDIVPQHSSGPESGAISVARVAGGIPDFRGASGRLGEPAREAFGVGRVGCDQHGARAATRSSAAPECTSWGVSRPRPLWRCSVLYQGKKTWQWSRAGRPGSSRTAPGTRTVLHRTISLKGVRSFRQLSTGRSGHLLCTCYARFIMVEKPINSVEELAALTQKEFLSIGERFGRIYTTSTLRLGRWYESWPLWKRRSGTWISVSCVWKSRRPVGDENQHQVRSPAPHD